MPLRQVPLLRSLVLVGLVAATPGCPIPNRTLSPPTDGSADAAQADGGLEGGGEDDGDTDAADAASQVQAPPECTAANFKLSVSTPIAGANQPAIQNIPAGVTPNAATILMQSGDCSIGLSLFIVDRLPQTNTYQALVVPSLTGIDTAFEENVALSGDGLSIIGVTASFDGFLMFSRSNTQLVDFAPAQPNPFAQIVPNGSQSFEAPVISSDGLAFYYVVRNDPTASVNGVYESIRTSTSAPFPQGVLMSAFVESIALYVTALSTDRLSIFVESKLAQGTVMLTRPTLSAPFGSPVAPAAAPNSGVLRVRPLFGCTKFTGTCGSGCNNEQACIWSASP